MMFLDFEVRIIFFSQKVAANKPFIVTIPVETFELKAPSALESSFYRGRVLIFTLNKTCQRHNFVSTVSQTFLQIPIEILFQPYPSSC